MLLENIIIKINNEIDVLNKVSHDQKEDWEVERKVKKILK